MSDQPRWPRGTPVGPSGRGPGGGRFRDDGKPNAPRPDWAGQVSARLTERITARTAPTSPDLRYHMQQGLWYESLEQYQATAWEGRLTRDQADRGMREWAGNKNGYRRMSELLRVRPSQVFKPTPAQRRSIQAIGHVDSIFADEATTTPVDLEVVRGLSAVSTLGMDLSDGAEFTADGYTAASFHEGWARSFTTDVRNDGALFRIRIPAGSRVLAAGVGSGDAGDIARQARHESEVLLPRGTRFRVVRRLEDTTVAVHGRRTDTVPVYEIEVVETPHPSQVPLPAAYRRIIERTRTRAEGAGGGLVGQGLRHMPRPADWGAQDRSAALEVLDRITKEAYGEQARLWWGGWDHRMMTPEQVQAASQELNIDLPSLRAFIRHLHR